MGSSHGLIFPQDDDDMKLFIILISFSLALSVSPIDEEPEDRLASTCPQYNRNIKQGMVVPSRCKLIRGKWVKSWQQCGALCMREKTCQAWTYNRGWCSMYRNGILKCGFVSSRSGVIAGVRGCTN